MEQELTKKKGGPERGGEAPERGGGGCEVEGLSWVSLVR